jgi:hypothetical protein
LAQADYLLLDFREGLTDYTVIASASEAIQKPSKERTGLLRWRSQ